MLDLEAGGEGCENAETEAAEILRQVYDELDESWGDDDELNPELFPKILGHERPKVHQQSFGETSRNRPRVQFMNDLLKRTRGRLAAELRHLAGDDLSVRLVAEGIPDNLATLIAGQADSVPPWEENTLPAESVLMYRKFKAEQASADQEFERWILNLFAHYDYPIEDSDLRARLLEILNDPDY